MCQELCIRGKESCSCMLRKGLRVSTRLATRPGTMQQAQHKQDLRLEYPDALHSASGL